MYRSILAFLVLVLAASAQSEPFRPAFHFTPEKNWMNDPNGMVFFEGEWHLFYQYNPHGNTWGHMSWGHAVSRDLVHWEHLPLALAEEDGVMIFSGSAVVDWKNTSGFGRDGRPPLVAIYTGHRQGRQDQRIAYSNDRGRTWTKFAKNPVLDLNMADFRDPKVCWHEATRRWVMTVALPHEKKVHFYTSPDLIAWKYTGEFGPAGGTGGMWECPDLFPVKIEGEEGSKWVLIVNINPGGPAGGSACQYFVGEFDGIRFTADAPPLAQQEFVPQGKVLADFEGADYAGWTAAGDAFGERPAAGTLARQQPVSGFRGAGLVNTYRDGDRSQGTLTSPAFEIDAGHLSFLIGGGAHAGETCVNLRVDGQIVRTATGDERERLAWKSWDVRELHGKRASLQIVDRRTDGWGHINVDHFILADAPARPAADGALWADYGPDFYAAVSWSDVPAADGRRVWLGWMSDWRYADKVPTHPWRSAMSVPRSLAVRRTPEGWRLAQHPVAELHSIRRGAPRRFAGGTFAEAAAWLAEQKDLPLLLEIEITCRDLAQKLPFALYVRTGSDEQTILACDPGNRRLTLDRTRSGQTGFHREFPGRHTAPVQFTGGQLSLRVFLDTSSLEVFAQNGETVFSELIFPTAGPRQLRLVCEGPAPAVTAISIHELQAAR
jgi:sucrose-6-phosphate hydrolase SacC (GH32 family)